MDNTEFSFQWTSALHPANLKDFIFHFCPHSVSKWKWWCVKQGSPPNLLLQLTCSGGTVCIMYRLLLHLHMWHSSHAGTLQKPVLDPIQPKKTDAFKWQSFKKVKKYSVVCKFHVMTSTCILYLYARYLFLSLSPLSVQRWSSGSNNNIVPQPSELRSCSLSPHPFSPHPSFRCWGYSRTWCGSWTVRLCSTDGPVLSPSLLLLLSASSVCLSCAAALWPWYL